MRHAWIAGCLLLVLTACSNKVTDSAVALTVEYKDYVPLCLQVTARDAAAPGRLSAEVITRDKLATDADRTLILAVYREKGWSQQLDIQVASFPTPDCSGSQVETRALAAVTLPAQGTVPAKVELKARDADKDGHVASSADSAIRGTDCDDGDGAIHPGATRRCGAVPDPTGDVDCDGIPECAQRASGESCEGSAMCKSGFCVGGVCCSSACDAPPMCRGAGSCGTGTCEYPVAVDQRCDDGNKCTTNDTCNAQGSCVGGAPMVCNSGPGACHAAVGTCVPADGGCYYAPLDAGTSCNDNSPCTFSDRCNGSGACVGTPKVCNTPGNQCWASMGTCIEADGGCTYPNLDAGTPCNDGIACSHTDVCNGGACSGTAYTCTPNECQESAAACAGDGGCIFTPDSTKDGTECAFFASQKGTCWGGRCSSFPYVPSNIDPDFLSPTQIDGLPSVRISCDTIFNSTTETWTLEAGCPTAAPTPHLRTLQQLSGPEARILSMKQLDIDPGKSFTLVGDRPVVLVVYGNATLTGKLVASATKQTPGAGGNGAGCGARTGGNGVVGAGTKTGGGGGGGGYGTGGASGGRGENGSSNGGTAGGTLTSTPALVPLVGGCPGGNGGGGLTATEGLGGAGGGAVQLAVSGTLQVKDWVSVSGGGGAGGNGAGAGAGAEVAGGGGGGSGGGILLEASILDLESTARLTANGGGGGEGGKLNLATPVKGADGADGSRVDNTPAPGGNTSTGGNGGNGATSSNGATVGANGNATNGGGGGGGGVGRIRLVGHSACTLNGTSLVSPAPIKGGMCL